jgi:uncharacterized protein
MTTRNEVFLDTSFAVALGIEDDVLHEQAVRLADRIREEQTRMVTTQAVLFEVGNFLSKKKFRTLAAALIDSLRSGGDVEILGVPDELFEEAFALYRDRPDKSWSLTDCLSFVVMRRYAITDALTADHHFRQAGFRPLLESPKR